MVHAKNSCKIRKLSEFFLSQQVGKPWLVQRSRLHFSKPGTASATRSGQHFPLMPWCLRPGRVGKNEGWPAARSCDMNNLEGGQTPALPMPLHLPTTIGPWITGTSWGCFLQPVEPVGWQLAPRSQIQWAPHAKTGLFQDMRIVQVNVLDPKPELLHQTQPSAVHDPRHQIPASWEALQHRLHLFAGQPDQQVGADLGASIVTRKVPQNLRPITAHIEPAEKEIFKVKDTRP